jgi:hypothetical protein
LTWAAAKLGLRSAARDPAKKPLVFMHPTSSKSGQREHEPPTSMFPEAVRAS